MAKYSEEFKIKLVTEYLDGNIGYKLLAKKYNMPSATPLQNWVRAYKTQGMEGLKRRKRKEVYPVQFKLNTIQFMLDTGASYQETTEQFGLNNPSLIHPNQKLILPVEIPETKNESSASDINRLKQLIQKYNIKYIFIGDKEYEKYPDLNEDNFKEIGGQIIFQSGKTKIYQL